MLIHPFRCLPAWALSVVALLSPLHAQNGETLPFYKLRFETAMTSDWMTVHLDNYRPWHCRVVSQDGVVSSVTAGINSANLVQPIQNAEAGVEVRMGFECAVPPELLRREFDLRIEKGHLGRVALRVHQILSEGTALLGEWTHDGIVPDADVVPNTVYLSLDLTEVLDAAPFQVRRLGLPKMAWAFYFPWYTRADWNTRLGLKDIPAEPYSSQDPRAISLQIEQAQSAGIGGFIVSWSGVASRSDQAMPTILEQAAERGFAIAARFETLDAMRLPREQADIEEQLANLLNQYGSHAAFAKVDGRPVIFVGDSSAIPRETWTGILDTVGARASDAFYLGQSLDQADLEVFESLYVSAKTDFTTLAEFVSAVRPASRHRGVLDDSPSLVLTTATVQPGFGNELVVPEGEVAIVEREDGSAYRQTIDIAVYRDQEWILIDSWNQYYNNTHIEPSEMYGTQYLDLTAELVDRWMGPRPQIYPDGVVNSASYRHGAVGLGEIVTIFGEGIGPPEICTLEVVDGAVSTTLCETEVTFNGNPAPLLYVRSDTLSAIVPLGLVQANARIQVRHQGVISPQKGVRIVPAVPGIYTLDSSGVGQAAALLANDYSVIGPQNPAERGSTVLVYLTAGGATQPPGDAGAIVTQIETLQLPVRVEVGGVPAQVDYAGSAPGLVNGVLQLNIRIPDDAPVGTAVALRAWIANYPTQEGVTIAVR